VKAIWHSNAPWAPTGYGQQTALFAPMLAERYEFALSSYYGLEGAPITWQGIPVLPGIGGAFGDEHLVQHAKRFFGGDARDGLVITLMDVWVLNPKWAREIRMACWVPVDHLPVPPKVVKFLLDAEVVPIAMSRFGEEQLQAAGLDALYVPHGVNTRVYRPHDKKAIREAGGFPEDAFLVGMVAANKGRPSRKSFAEVFQAFGRFSEKHDNAFLYLHTHIDPNYAGGENIPALLESCGIPQDRVRIADQYSMGFSPYSHESMAHLYSALDVLVNPAKGEGFGIPVLEAQACGVPVIVTDFTAMKEIAGAGWHVKYTPWWTGLDSWQANPDVDDIVEALEECYSLPDGQREKLSHAARGHALGYDSERVWKEHWCPVLDEVERRVMPSVQKVAA
jgi:glycosyltransferase involved in cell wall biosynthesis